jgi:SNF2 family DNA or RNA helicase
LSTCTLDESTSLLTLLRLRQICDHPSLLPSKVQEATKENVHPCSRCKDSSKVLRDFVALVGDSELRRLWKKYCKGSSA